MHEWNDGKISNERRQLAGFINDMQTSIQQTLLSNYAEAEEPRVPDGILAQMYALVAKYDKDLWTASKTPVGATMQSSGAIFELLRQSPQHGDDVAADVTGHARVVDDAMQTLTTLQNHTMLTIPTVALARKIAVDAKIDIPVCSQRYRWWVQQAADIARHAAEIDRRLDQDTEGRDVA